MSETAAITIISACAGYVVLYYVIRHAVSAGIRDAQRKRDVAEAERQRVAAERARSGYTT